MRQEKQWPWFALVMMFIGALGNVQNIIIFTFEYHVVSGVVGVLGMATWYLIYRRSFWGLLILNILIVFNLWLLIGRMIFVDFSMNIMGNIVFQTAFLLYFDYQLLEGMFEV